LQSSCKREAPGLPTAKELDPQSRRDRATGPEARQQFIRE